MSKKIECVFVCTSNKASDDNPEAATVEFQVATEETHPDHPHWRYTPSGEIWMGLEAPGAPDLYEPGATYRVTFERI